MMQDWKEHLRALRKANNDVAWTMSEYIDETPCSISASLMSEVNPGGRLPEEAIVAALIAGFSGIDENDRLLNGYFNESVRKLDAEAYARNPYLETITFPDVSAAHWKFTHYTYKPYEIFIRDDISVLPNLQEIPQLGYFDCRFTYPAVEQDGREWMAVKPSEIATMQPVIDLVSGNVITFGLGLGYFAFMASQKSEVESVTVVERDEEAIGLFSKYILPQFPNKDKVQIVRSDAFEYMRNSMLSASERDFDFAFVDLWHDTSDGLESYLCARKIETELKNTGCGTVFHYWVERSLLSAFRWNVFDKVLDNCSSLEEAYDRLSDASLKRYISSFILPA